MYILILLQQKFEHTNEDVICKVDYHMMFMSYKL